MSSAAAVAWGLLAFSVYFYFAQFVRQIGWNAIELIIAQHVLHHGVYGTSLDYPSALTWRPIGPTLLVTILRAFTSDPIRIYQIYCGTACGVFAASMFFAARAIWGRMAGHLAALLAMICPAVTTYLLNHTHSYSHLGALVFLGPALAASVTLVAHSGTESLPPRWQWLLVGFLWGLCYLCRSELVLFAILFFVQSTWLFWRTCSRSVFSMVTVFACFFLGYNWWADRVAARDGILIRKPIYGFYISQGWADPPSGVGPDIEADGYRYAQKLYGTPEENRESLLAAISNNPAALLRRMRLNAQEFYSRFGDRDFCGLWLSSLAISVAIFASTPLCDSTGRRSTIFLVGVFAASHFVFLYHIDARYLTISIPSVLLLASGVPFCGAQLLRRVPRRFAVVGLAVPLVLVSYGVYDHLRRLSRHGARNQASVDAFRALGSHFRHTVKTSALPPNREPHLRFVFPKTSPLFPEDQFLLAYYSHTAWNNGEAGGAFPRGRFYSYRDCPDDFFYVPEDQISDYRVFGGGKIVAQCDNPVLGRYYLLQMRR